MTKNRTPTPVYLDPGMHHGLEVKGLNGMPVRHFVSRERELDDSNKMAAGYTVYTSSIRIFNCLYFI